MHKTIADLLEGKRILILGFGKEGVSTYRLLKRTIQPDHISIADMDENLLSKLDFKIHPHCQVISGKNYLNNINDFDVIIKTPGISLALLNKLTDNAKITSQTELFLKIYAHRTIGVTGTKGKSTTSSLISHILSSYYKDVVLVGNIGIPPFDLIDNIGDDTWIVYELSSHQLEQVSASPFIAVILNLYEEHLDHYESYSKYQLAKLNITRFQSEADWFVMNNDNQTLADLYEKLGFKRNLLTFSMNLKTDAGAFINKNGEIIYHCNGMQSKFNFRERKYLPGDHNLMNIMAAICVSKIMKISDDLIDKSIHEFKGLKHRMEYLGKFKGIEFYNDSISTIPQATIQAVLSLKKVDTLILGGKDRGINYQPLIDFLPVSGVRNLIFTGEAGKRILYGLKKSIQDPFQKYFVIKSFAEISEIINAHTRQGYICLLSPAAASYDSFRNFEERGEVFKNIAENI
jgi:UDP-N-acetylmuramoyl-L-alanine---L-glutamate ligase